MENVNISIASDVIEDTNDATCGDKFSIDYSKQGTARCRKCKKVIPKGYVRIGKTVPFKVGHITQYFHVDCAFESFLKAKLETNVITDINEIDGIESVPADVKSRIVTLINDTSMKRTKPLATSTANTKKSVVIQGTSKSRIVKLKSLGLPALKVMFTNADQMTPSKLVELKKQIEAEKPLIVAVSEVKQKKNKIL